MMSILAAMGVFQYILLILAVVAVVVWAIFRKR